MSATTQYDTPRAFTAKYSNDCKVCRKPIVQGQPAFIYNGRVCTDVACVMGQQNTVTAAQPTQQPAARQAPQPQAPEPQPPIRPLPNQMTVSEGFNKIDTFASIHQHAWNLAALKARDIYPGEKDTHDRRVTTAVIYKAAINYVIHG